MKALAAAHRQLLEALGLTTGLIVATTVVVIVADVALRTAQLGTIAWANEITEHSVFVATFLGVPWVMRLGGHIRIDILFTFLSDEQARWLEILNSTIGLIVSVLLCYYGLLATLEVYQSGRVIFKLLTPKEWWLLAVIPFSLFLLSIEFLLRLVRMFGKSSPDTQPPLAAPLGF